MSRKLIGVNDLSSDQYSVNKNIRFKALMLRSHLCDYIDTYVVVKVEKTVKGIDNTNRKNKKVTFKNDAPFRSCISKVSNTFIDKAEDLDIVISIYIFLEYIYHYFMTSGSLWNYYRDKLKMLLMKVMMLAIIR